MPRNSRSSPNASILWNQSKCSVDLINRSVKAEERRYRSCGPSRGAGRAWPSKKAGCEPEKCSIYEFLVFHLSDDDKELQELDAECRSGRRMCGTCKKDVAGRIESFLREHQQAREAAKERLPEFGITV